MLKPPDKTPAPRSPASEFDPVFIWPTPNHEDLLFWVEKNGDLPKNKTWQYGDPYWDAVKYPNHKLVYVTPQTPDHYSRWYYASDRISQDSYNWSFTQADIGGSKFDAVDRTYLTPRATYNDASPAMGATMPDTPADVFSGTYVLASRKQVRTGDETFDSLYVAETRTYVRRATLGEIRFDQKTGRNYRDTVFLYYRGESVSGTPIETLAATPSGAYWSLQTDGSYRTVQQVSDNWWAVTASSVIPANAINSISNPAKTRVQERVTPLGTDIIFAEVGQMPVVTPTYGSAHYDTTNWPNHKLAYIESADETGLLHKFWYVANRSSQDSYNWQFSQADIGGTKFDSVERTYLTLRASFSPTTYTMGAAMPNTPTGLFSGTYILAERKQTRIGQPYLDNLYVAETLVYVKRTTIIRYDFDEFSGTDLKTTQTLYYAGELISGTAVETVFANNTGGYFGLQSSGVYREGEQLTANWFSVLDRQIIPNGFSRTYTASVNYSWPPVLEGIEIMDWVLKDGATRNYVRPYFSKEGYSGPCKATITEAWSSTPATVSTVTPMKPLPIHYPSPILPVSIDSCLHEAVELVSDTGSADPFYGTNVGSARTFAATTPTDWPSSILMADDQKPFRGGYLRTSITVYAPS